MPIANEADIVAARQRGRTMAIELGFAGCDGTLIATAISEVARNILLYAQRGEIILCCVELGGRRGLSIEARDSGPGIPDLRKALTDGYSTSRGLGLGLPGSRRLMDEFAIESEVGRGTNVTMTKWVR
ncbi:MAG: anti-sigma regulatory factor [Phycisphaerae bacterium]|nr:anti-sigma regulatory factor [Phycisphaerae bacterium]